MKQWWISISCVTFSSLTSYGFLFADIHHGMYPLFQRYACGRVTVEIPPRRSAQTAVLNQYRELCWLLLISQEHHLNSLRHVEMLYMVRSFQPLLEWNKIEEGRTICYLPSCFLNANMRNGSHINWTAVYVEAASLELQSVRHRGWQMTYPRGQEADNVAEIMKIWLYCPMIMEFKEWGKYIPNSTTIGWF